MPMRTFMAPSDHSQIRSQPAGRPRSETSQCLAQRIQAERTKREGLTVEVLEAEVRALALAGLFPRLHPDPLAKLVRRHLARPAQIPVELEPEHLVFHVHPAAQELP